MNLREFVKESLVQIVGGVNDAVNELQESGAVVNPRRRAGPPSQMHRGSATPIQDIEFDVAVTIGSTAETTGGGSFGLQVFSIGAKSSSGTDSQSVSRIRFSVPLALPARDERLTAERTDGR